MATVKDIYSIIDGFAPFCAQEEWDNSGLLVGNEKAEVKKILFALDITNDVVCQAVICGANLIITHHPVIFGSVSNVLSDSLAYKLIENNINIICAHTNYDRAVDGVNDILCEIVGLKDITKVENSFLNIGYIPSLNSMDTNDFANYIKTRLNGTVRYNNINKKISKVAVCSGSGSDFLAEAKNLGCDALLTGDGSHHSFLDANEMDILLVCAGHFETENIAILPLLNKIKEVLDIECELAEQESPIITI